MSSSHASPCLSSVFSTALIRWRTAIMVLGLFILAATIYWPVHEFGFVLYDDMDYVVDNPHTHAGFSRGNLHYAFATAPLGNWAPLVWISYFADQQFFQLRPGPMHVENVVLHGLSGILLWLLLRDATKSNYRSFIVAVLFVVHPMHVESVAWISERKDVLSTVLLFAATWSYICYARANSRSRFRWFATAVTMYALSLMAKAMGITLPAVLLLLDFWPLRRTFIKDGRPIGGAGLSKLLAEKIPFIALSVTAALAAILAQRAVGATSTMHALPLSLRIENIAVTFPIYILKLFLPIHLAVFYPHPGEWPATAVIAGAALLGLISFCTLRQQRRHYLAVGWLWFLITLLPVSGLAQVGAQSMADRYSYLPSVGLFIMVVWGSAEVISTGAMAQVAAHADRVAMLVLVSVVTVYAVVARSQVDSWRGSRSLYQQALAATGSNWLAHYGLGNIAFDSGQLQIAIDEYNRSIHDRSMNSEAYDGLGHCWQRERPELAVKYFRQAVNFDPRTPKYRVSLASGLVTTGDLAGAAEQLQKVLADYPEFPAAVIGIADVEARLHRQTSHPETVVKSPDVVGK